MHIVHVQVQARDLDPTSDVRYSIVSPHNPPFWVEPSSGRISVLPGKLLDAADNKYILTVMVSSHSGTYIYSDG